MLLIFFKRLFSTYHELPSHQKTALREEPGQLSLPSWPQSTVTESLVHSENSSCALGVAAESVRWRLLALDLLLSLLASPLPTPLNLTPAPCLFHTPPFSLCRLLTLHLWLAICLLIFCHLLTGPLLYAHFFFFFFASSEMKPCGWAGKGKRWNIPIRILLFRHRIKAYMI